MLAAQNLSFHGISFKQRAMLCRTEARTQYIAMKHHLFQPGTVRQQRGASRSQDNATEIHTLQLRAFGKSAPPVELSHVSVHLNPLHGRHLLESTSTDKVHMIQRQGFQIGTSFESTLPDAPRLPGENHFRQFVAPIKGRSTHKHIFRQYDPTDPCGSQSPFRDGVQPFGQIDMRQSTFAEQIRRKRMLSLHLSPFPVSYVPSSATGKRNVPHVQHAQTSRCGLPLFVPPGHFAQEAQIPPVQCSFQRQVRHLVFGFLPHQFR